MLHISNLAQNDILKGYAFVGLYRLQYQLALALGVVGWGSILGAVRTINNATLASDFHADLLTCLGPAQSLFAGLKFIAFIVLGVAFGLMLGSQIRNIWFGVALICLLFLSGRLATHFGSVLIATSRSHFGAKSVNTLLLAHNFEVGLVVLLVLLSWSMIIIEASSLKLAT